MRSEPYQDELHTFLGYIKQRRHRRNGGSSCAMDERRCGHDMMMMKSEGYFIALYLFNMYMDDLSQSLNFFKLADCRVK